MTKVVEGIVVTDSGLRSSAQTCLGKTMVAIVKTPKEAKSGLICKADAAD